MPITRLPSRIVKKLKAIHWVYLLLYLLLQVAGLFLVMYGSSLEAKAYGTIFVGVGGSLIATGIAGWVLFLHVWLSQDKFDRMEIIRKFGLIEAFERRSVPIRKEYDIRLDRVSEAIDIMGFGLQHLREDYNEDFTKWAARAKVRILLLDPEFPSKEFSIADLRDKEEKQDHGDISKQVRAFVRACAGLLKNKPEHFKIRLYRCLPSINIFRIDDNLFWGPYLIGDVSRNFPTFLLDKQGILFGRLLEHFDSIWENNEFSREVPSEWFEPDVPESES